MRVPSPAASTMACLGPVAVLGALAIKGVLRERGLKLYLTTELALSAYHTTTSLGTVRRRGIAELTQPRGVARHSQPELMARSARSCIALSTFIHASHFLLALRMHMAA